MPADEPGFRSSLTEIVGPSHVLDDRQLVASYVVDWTGRFIGRTDMVVRPGSTEEVASVVELCRSHGVALVPQGGNTGLVGGSVPLDGELVLSLRRLNELELDQRAGQVTAGAGVTVGDLERAAAGAGWDYGIDLASRDSATVGGTIATNAGGVRVLRHGDTRAQVLGTECVLGTGRTLSHMSGLLKDNTGYAIGSLLCGSEGTLGIVTAARLRLVRPLPEHVVALVGFVTAQAAVDAAASLRRLVGDLSAIEFFLDSGLALVCETSGAARPFVQAFGAYLLVECAGDADPTDGLAEALASIPGIEGVAVASDPQRRAALWHYREAHTEAIATLGVVHKLDVSLPAAQLGEFVEAVTGLVRQTVAGARVWLFGHAGDGNVHVNITGLAPDDERADEAVLRLVAQSGGSISAEHGIGTAKRRWLGLVRSPDEIKAFRSIKQALDPDRVLNPHVLLPE